MITDVDSTETLRRDRLVCLNASRAQRATLEQRYGRVWNTVELGRDFVVLGYLAPYVVVDRKADRSRGSLEFQDHPRFYFNWEEDQ